MADTEKIRQMVVSIGAGRVAFNNAALRLASAQMALRRLPKEHGYTFEGHIVQGITLPDEST